MSKSTRTKSQIKYLKLYITFGIVILLLPVVAYGANVVREQYVKSKNNSISKSNISSSSTLPNSVKLIKINDLFGLEIEMPNEKWKATVESRTGSKEQVNRQLSIRIGDTSNSINVNIQEFRRQTKDMGYLNPNGEMKANDFGIPTIFKKAFDNKVVPVVVIDKPNLANNIIMTDNQGNKVGNFKIARLEDEQQRRGQILFNANTKRESGRDLTKEGSISYPMYDTNFQLFPEFASKYSDRFLYLRIDYGTAFKLSYEDYDKVIQSLKLVEF